MYESHFQFNVRPFPSEPRTEFYFPAAPIENAYHSLARLIERAEGPGVLIGGPGTGKSLVCQLLAARFREKFHVVMLSSAQLDTRRALLQHILFELGLPYRGMDEGELRLSLIEFLVQEPSAKAGILLLVDEAHTLPLPLFEDIRMITNLARDGQSCVRVVMSGGSPLEEHFAHPQLASFNQRLAARCYLQPLNYDETCAYVHSQIAKTGAHPDQILAHDAWQAIYHATDGIPRLINQVCDHALMLACEGQRGNVDGHTVEAAWADLQQLPAPWQPSDKEPSEEAGVVEFGELGDEDSQERGLVELEMINEEERTTEPEDDLERAVPEFESSLDLSERLDEVQRQLDEMKDCDECSTPSLTRESAEVRLSFPDGENAVTSPSTNPFDERFDQEEAVVDRYATLQTTHPGDTPTILKQREITSAMLTIFDNVPQSDSSPSIAPESSLSDTESSEETPRPVAEENTGQESTTPARSEQSSGLETLAEQEPDDIEEQVLQTIQELGLTQQEGVTDPGDRLPVDSCDENGQEVCIPMALDEEQDQANRVEVIRTPPPDDNDMIIVVDNERGKTPLRSSGGINHRQEYRQLFSRLRQS